MLMIDPAPAASMCLPTVVQAKKTLLRLVAMIRSKSASAKSSAGLSLVMPCELTSTSMRPWRAITWSTSRPSAAVSATSAAWPAAAGSLCRSRTTTSSTLASDRPTGTTEAPASRKASAISRPMPLLPPITSATLPASEKRDARSIVRLSSEIPVGEPPSGGAGLAAVAQPQDVPLDLAAEPGEVALAQQPQDLAMLLRQPRAVALVADLEAEHDHDMAGERLPQRHDNLVVGGEADLAVELEVGLAGLDPVLVRRLAPH